MRIYVASAAFQPYRDLEAGVNQSLKIQVARPGVEPGIFQGYFWGRISAPSPMEKGPVFSQKVDEISQSEVHQTFNNFSSLFDEYIGIQSWQFLAYSSAKKDTM